MTGTYRIVTADAFDALGVLEPGSFDGVLCDPPYGLSFMGARWDHGVPSATLWAHVLRALRPGAALLAFGGTRTHHRLVSAIEDSGFEIRDCLMYLYGSGFPKSLDIGKAIDKAAGKSREVVGRKGGRYATPKQDFRGGALHSGADTQRTGIFDAITAPATPEAALWEGYGSALKPAYEPITLAMKPLDGTYAHNALTHGVAGLNVDGCRIGTSKDVPASAPVAANKTYGARPKVVGDSDGYNPNVGRWPANLLLDEHAAQALDADVGERITHGGPRRNSAHKSVAKGHEAPNTTFGYAETGGPSRYFYTAKSSAFERGAGLPEGMVNGHPCLKPLDLCRYLATLILPPDTGRPRRLLVPFSGSGSEIVGALLAGWDDVTGIEMNPDYVAIAEHRIRHWTTPGAWKPKAKRAAAEPASETRIKAAAHATADERTELLPFAVGT